MRGRASLILTSPPYGPATHGHVKVSRDSGEPRILKRNHRYGPPDGNLAYGGVEELMEGFTEILTGCRTLLRPGGYLVMTTRPFRRSGALVDIPALATQAAIHAGFTLHERCVALLAAACDDGLMARASFFQLVNARTAFAAGNPTHITAHEEVAVLRVPKSPEPAMPDRHGSAEHSEDFDPQGCGCVPTARCKASERAA